MKFIFFCCSFLYITEAMATIDTKWEKIKERKGVEVFSGDVSGTNVVAFKGVATIDASMEKVASVIYDVSRIKEWMSDLKESRIIEKKSKFQKVEYNRTSAPWPLSDRDFIYSVDFKVDKTENTVEIMIENASSPNVPEVPGVIRGALLSSRYYLRALDNNSKTHIEVEILADPKGSIPKWVVNLFQSGWPSNTISGIKRIATEDNYQVHPDIAEYIKSL